jgi:hypothetical protein
VPVDRRTRQVSYFEDDDNIQGQKKSSVLLLRNVVKPEDVDDPISVSGCASSPASLYDQKIPFYSEPPALPLAIG